jgi:hypothetical protein
MTPPDASRPPAELELPPSPFSPPVGRVPPVVDEVAPPELVPPVLASPPFVVAVPEEPPLPESERLSEQAGTATKQANVQLQRPRVVTPRR